MATISLTRVWLKQLLVKSGIRILAVVCFGVLLSGCATVHHPNVGLIYDRMASYHGPERNPVIVIPGIMGSKLVDQNSGKVVWGAFAGGFLDPNRSEGARMAGLPMHEGVRLSDLKDSIIPAGALDNLSINLFILPVRLKAYYNLLRILGVGGYRDEDLGRSGFVDYGKEHFTCFQFSYDWRRDNVENAKLLDKFIKEKKRYVQAELEKRFGIKNASVKFDIVAHSMGGLIARYYLMYGSKDMPEDGSRPIITWAGSEYVDKLIMVAPPNAGSVQAFTQLVNGFDMGPFIPKYQPALLGTMPAIYQLLPSGKGAVLWGNGPSKGAVDIFDPGIWEKMGWGLASPKQDSMLKMLLPDILNPEERHRVALDHQKKCLVRAKEFQDAINAQALPPEGVSLYLFAGDAILTDAVVIVNAKNGKIRTISQASGDGTVLRSSALMDERLWGEWSPNLVSPIQWSNTMFLFTDHLGMTKDPSFNDNILYVLLEQPGKKNKDE